MALSFLSCQEIPTPPDEQSDKPDPGYPEEPVIPEEQDDPTVLKVQEGEDLSAILADIPEGIKTLFLTEGTFTGPFKMIEGPVLISGKTVC